MPLPIDTLLRVQASPVPAQIVFGACGSTARAPMDCTDSLSKMGLNVVPPFEDFHTPPRSEEHTSELQSHLNLVCRLLLEKKKKITTSRETQNPETIHTEHQLGAVCVNKLEGIAS